MLCLIDRENLAGISLYQMKYKLPEPYLILWGEQEVLSICFFSKLFCQCIRHFIDEKNIAVFLKRNLF